MVKEAKQTTKQLSNDTKTAIKNGVRLVEAVALLVVSVFAVYGAYHYNVSTGLFYPLVVSGVIIGLRGAIEFFRHLAEK